MTNQLALFFFIQIETHMYIFTILVRSLGAKLGHMFEGRHQKRDAERKRRKKGKRRMANISLMLSACWWQWKERKTNMRLSRFE